MKNRRLRSFSRFGPLTRTGHIPGGCRPLLRRVARLATSQGLKQVSQSADRRRAAQARDGGGVGLHVRDEGLGAALGGGRLPHQASVQPRGREQGDDAAAAAARGGGLPFARIARSGRRWQRQVGCAALRRSCALRLAAFPHHASVARRDEGAGARVPAKPA